MASSQEVVVTRSSNDLAALDEFDAILLGAKNAPQIVTDPEQAQKEIVQQLLSAESDEELEAFGSATPWQELEGVPVRIYGFRYRPSTFDAGAPVFVVVDVENLQTGDRMVVTTGGYNILAQLSNLARRDRFPVIRELKVSEKETSRGFHPLWLVTPEPAKVALAESMADESNPLDEE